MRESKRDFPSGLGRTSHVHHHVKELESEALCRAPLEFNLPAVGPPASNFLPGTVPLNDQERMRLLLYKRDPNVPQHQVRWNWIADVPFGAGKPILGGARGLLNQIVAVGRSLASGGGGADGSRFPQPTGRRANRSDITERTYPFRTAAAASVVRVSGASCQAPINGESAANAVLKAVASSIGPTVAIDHLEERDVDHFTGTA